MNIKFKHSILRDEIRYNQDDEINLPENISKVWIQKGFASKISKKVNKAKFETKELKVEYIEIK